MKPQLNVLQISLENAEQPEIERAETVSDVMTLVVTSELGDLNLRSAAEHLADQLLALPDVTLVSLMGAKELEIAVEVDEQALRQFDISINQVAQAIRSSSINPSAGELRTDAGDLLLRTNQKRMSGASSRTLCCAQIPTAASCV